MRPPNLAHTKILRDCFLTHKLESLNKKNATSLTPLSCALKALILALKDSLAAFVALFLKKATILR